MLGIRLGHSLRHSVEHRLSSEQRILVDCKIGDTKADFLAHLHEELGRYVPGAECERCHYNLNSAEILKGFRDDPVDVSTLCPKCGFRFNAQFVMRTDAGRAYMGFYCAAQTLHRLSGFETLPTHEIKRKDQPLYRSALFHFGSIKKAFSLLEIDYIFDEVTDWQTKIQDFLGKLPDTFIAAAVSKSVALIRRIRNSLNIPKFKKSDLLEE